jgi:diguanylate cyclase (GGDEF)-like protein
VENGEGSFTVEMRLRHVDGSTRLTVATLTAPDEWEGRIILNLHDITTQRGLEELLRHQATHDHLTGLWNRAAFQELVSTSCARAARHGTTLGVMFVDLDGFKQVNDTQGHDAGDAVLKEAASRIQRALRQTEILARLGGDEFAVLAEPVEGHEHLVDIAVRLLDALAEPWDGIGDATLAASIGIASHTGAGAHPELLLRLADAAMYEAKRRGGHQWQAACPTIRAEHGKVTEVRLPST